MCAPGQFRCPEGKCISSQLVCNYQRDCEKGEDEYQSCRKSILFSTFPSRHAANAICQRSHHDDDRARRRLHPTRSINAHVLMFVAKRVYFHFLMLCARCTYLYTHSFFTRAQPVISSFMMMMIKMLMCAVLVAQLRMFTIIFH